MKVTIVSSVLIILSVSVASAQASHFVRFDKQRYDIGAGETFPVQILIELVPEAGLHSFGLSVIFDSAHASIRDAAALTPAPGLDFNGVNGAGALKAIVLGKGSVKGTVRSKVIMNSYGALFLRRYSVEGDNDQTVFAKHRQ